jgi:hypothetical protein
MSLNLEVGEVYAAKTYLENGYNFPEGEYKLKIIHDGFPEDPINQEEELVVAEEQWLEGLEGTAQYQKDIEDTWYYFEFPENEDAIEYMWIPESVVIEVFK